MFSSWPLSGSRASASLPPFLPSSVCVCVCEGESFDSVSHFFFLLMLLLPLLCAVKTTYRKKKTFCHVCCCCFVFLLMVFSPSSPPPPPHSSVKDRVPQRHRLKKKKVDDDIIGELSVCLCVLKAPCCVARSLSRARAQCLCVRVCLYSADFLSAFAFLSCCVSIAPSPHPSFPHPRGSHLVVSILVEKRKRSPCRQPPPLNPLSMPTPPPPPRGCLGP